MLDPYAHYTPWGDRLLVITATDWRNALSCDRWQRWRSLLMDLGLSGR